MALKDTMLPNCFDTGGRFRLMRHVTAVTMTTTAPPNDKMMARRHVESHVALE